MMTSMRLIAAYINGVVVVDSDVATAADAGDITMDIWYNADDDTDTLAAAAAAEDDIVDDDYDDEGDEAEVIAKHTTYRCCYKVYLHSLLLLLLVLSEEKILQLWCWWQWRRQSRGWTHLVKRGY